MHLPKKKQSKITTLFKKGKTQPDDIVELQTEIDELEQQLKEKQNDLFILQRESFRQKARKPTITSEVFIRPEKIVLENSVEHLKNNLELLGMLTGMEVTSYVADDHCSVVYHMQHDLQHEVKHGFRIEMQSGGNEISKSSLPLGFNLDAVTTDHDSIMKPECLRTIRTALMAYYDRLAQFEALKKLVTIEAQLFKILDASHVEITFAIHADDEEEVDPVTVVLIVDYDVTGFRPKSYQFKKKGISEETLEVLTQQCLVFMKKPLSEAFREAFMEEFGRYKLVQQVGHRTVERHRRRPHKRARAQRPDYNNDDTFLPEDCSEMSDYDD